MSSKTNIRVIKKHTARERLRAIFANRYGSLRNMKILLLLLQIFLLVQVVIGQSRNSFEYFEDKTLSDKDGSLWKNNAYHFPSVLLEEDFIKSYIEQYNIKQPPSQVEYNLPDSISEFIEQFVLSAEISSNIHNFKMASIFLKSSNEPIMYNYQFKKETYRFTWIPSFNDNIIFTLIMDQEGAKLLIKRLENDFLRKFSVQTFRMDSSEVEEFKIILNERNFENINMIELTSCILDGATCILEANRKDGYHIINRSSPSKQSPMRGIINFFLKYFEEDWKYDYYDP